MSEGRRKNRPIQAAAEAVRALYKAFPRHLDDAAEDLDRAAVVRALDALTRRRKRTDGDHADRPKGAAITGRTAAYGRAAFAWAVKRGAVQHNPFADLPVAKNVTRRERVLTTKRLRRFGAPLATPQRLTARLFACSSSRDNAVAK